MGGLLNSLQAATSGMAASELGLEVAGQNMSNINTPGYSRQVVNFAAIPAVSAESAGDGVTASVTSVRDQYVQASIWAATPAESADNAVVSSLTPVNAAMGQPGAGLDSQLSSFFDAFATLAGDPSSTALRDQAVTQGQTLASAFNQMSSQFTTAQQQADQQIGGDIQQVNQLASQVAQLNGQIGDGGPDVQSLTDQRNLDVTTMAGLVNVTAIQNPNGTVDVTVGQGRPLVVGAQSYALTGTATPPQGFLAISDNGTDITSELTGGDIGGLLQVRDSIIPGYQSQLDQMAYGVETQVNALSQAGYDANGNPGGDFFTAPASAAGAAAAMSVAAPVQADSNLVAVSSTGAPGDNGTATAISNLRNDTIVAGGLTPTNAWGQLAFQVGSDASNAQSASTSQTQVVSQLQALEQQASGVSLDEEASNLMMFQRSYEASARYFSTVVTTLDILMSMIPT